MITEVPCGDCNLCCIKGGIKLEPPDYDENGEPRFIVMPELSENRHLLGFREDEKRCVYLHKGKCAIHNDKPAVCRAFDCRKLAVIFSKAQMTDFADRGLFPMDWWERGKELLLAEVET